MHWNKPLKRIAKSVKNPLVKFRLGLKQRLGWLDIPKVQPFLGFGNAETLQIRGRVIEDAGLKKPKENQSIRRNIIAMFKRYESEEFPGVTIELEINGKKYFEETDEAGFFHFVVSNPFPPLPEEEKWIKVKFKLLDEITEDQGLIEEKGEIYLPPDNASFGIISDVDDTILISRSTNFIRRLRLLLFKNALTRLPFDGVSGFYKALQAGNTSTRRNPIFFVSSSQWNVYDLLLDFCTHHDIPKAPFLLRTLEKRWFEFWKERSPARHGHKFEKIKHILETYNHLPFILIGDSGQRDPEIYSRVAMEYPSRIAALYIRDVTTTKRHRQVKEIAENLREKGVEMLMVKDTGEAELHARKSGFIR